MASPWEIPPPPAVGDASEDITFAAVGRALTRWEEFEVKLADLFAILVGTENNTAPAIRAYGSVIAFRGRTDLIRAAAEVHFAMFPDDTLEKTFRSFISEASHASGRRNEIAHGIVRPFISSDGNETRTYALFPPYYALKRNEMDKIEFRPGGHQLLWHKPKQFYSSAEINHFAEGFRGLIKPLLITVTGPIFLAKRGLPPSSP